MKENYDFKKGFYYSPVLETIIHIVYVGNTVIYNTEEADVTFWADKDALSQCGFVYIGRV